MLTFRKKCVMHWCWPTAKHLAPPHPHQWNRGEKSNIKREETQGSEWRQLNKWRKGKWQGNPRYKGDHLSPPTSRPLPSQSLSSKHPGSKTPVSLESFFYPSFYCKAWRYTGWNNHLGSLGQLFLLCRLPDSWPNPSLPLRWDGGSEWEKRKAWHCSRTIQQQLKYYCVINTLLTTNSEHCIIKDAVKKFNSIPSRACTKRKEEGSWQCRPICLDAVAYEDLEKIFEGTDIDMEVNEKGDKMQCGFTEDSSSLSNLWRFFFLVRKLIFRQSKCVRFPLSGVQFSIDVTSHEKLQG